MSSPQTYTLSTACNHWQHSTSTEVSPCPCPCPCLFPCSCLCPCLRPGLSEEGGKGSGGGTGVTTARKIYTCNLSCTKWWENWGIWLCFPTYSPRNITKKSASRRGKIWFLALRPKILCMKIRAKLEVILLPTYICMLYMFPNLIRLQVGRRISLDWLRKHHSICMRYACLVKFSFHLGIEWETWSKKIYSACLVRSIEYNYLLLSNLPCQLSL